MYVSFMKFLSNSVHKVKKNKDGYNIFVRCRRTYILYNCTIGKSKGVKHAIHLWSLIQVKGEKRKWKNFLFGPLQYKCCARLCHEIIYVL